MPALPPNPAHRRALLQRGLCWGLAAAVGSALALRSAVGVATPAPHLHLAIGVAQGASLNNLPLWLAHGLGFFRAEGLSVDWVHLGTEAGGTAALASGQIDMLSCDFAHTLSPPARLADLTAFVVQARTPQMVFGVLHRALGGYRQFSDLRGRRVCTLPATAASQLVIRRLMQDAGLSAPDLSIVRIAEPADLLDQARSGSMDAFCMDHAMVAALEQRGEVRLVADTRTLKGTLDVFGGPMPGAVVCAPADYIEAHPEACQGVANAVVRALKWLRTAGPPDLVRALAAVPREADRANYLAALEKSREGFMGDGVLSPAAAATALAALRRTDASVSLGRTDLMQAYTNSFAQRAKTRLRV